MAVVGHVPAVFPLPVEVSNFQGSAVSSVITAASAALDLARVAVESLTKPNSDSIPCPSSERTKVANACRSLADSLSGMLL